MLKLLLFPLRKDRTLGCFFLAQHGVTDCHGPKIGPKIGSQVGGLDFTDLGVSISAF